MRIKTILVLCIFALLMSTQVALAGATRPGTGGGRPGHGGGPSPSGAPEPQLISLMAIAGVGGAIFVAKRRKKDKNDKPE